ncbi:NADPH-dependent FMN reductase [Nocardia sp. NPDC051321]|uniref:NADPH-dependent FMN reductase n=1 Tax=Nocardia sp. NPDC051321 TaxID=3364323 RepID=UPI0037A25F26
MRSDIEVGPRAHVVVLAGSLNPASKAERLARWCIRRSAELGASTRLFRGTDLEFPFYRAGTSECRAAARDYLDELRKADGVLLVSPAYHASPSGLLKNALDYVNELAADAEPYLDGRPIGCVAVAGGDQGAHATLAGLRTISHALRAWPTPLGLALSHDRADADEQGRPTSLRTIAEVDTMLAQVIEMAQRRAIARTAACADRYPAPGLLR